MKLRCIQYAIFGLLLISLPLILSVFWSQPLLAHDGASHTIFNLPACTARMTSCAIPTADDSAAGATHCVDGLGVARPCDTVTPFTYFELDKSGEKLLITRDLEPLGPTPCVDGFVGDHACNNVDLLSFLPMQDMGDATLNDLWGWTDPETGKEYALVGVGNGTSFIDISDPRNPIYLGKLPSHTGSSPWRDVKVYQNHAFIVADSITTHGVQVFDLTTLRMVYVASRSI